MPDARNNVPSFYAGFLKLFSGLMVVQLLNFSFALILPRYYSPEDYALLGIFTAVVFILLEIMALKLEVTLFFPKEDSEALEILHVIFLIAVIISFLLFIGSIPLSIYYNPIYIFLPAVLLIYGFAQPICTWFTRTQEYHKLNTYRIILAITTPVFSLIFIIVLHWHFGLVLGFVFGQFCGLLYLLFSFDHVHISLMNFSSLKKYVRQYRQFPTFGVLSALLNSFSRNSIVIFIERFFGVMNAGYYTMASRILNTPAGMYQSSLSQVYAQQAAQLDSAGLKAYTKRTVWFGFTIGIIPVLIALLFAPAIFEFLFGAKWVASGQITQYIVLWFFSMAIINPVGLLVDVKQKLKFELGWNMAMLVFRLSAIAIGVILKDFYLMLLIISAVGVVMNLYLLWYVLKLTDDPGN